MLLVDCFVYTANGQLTEVQYTSTQNMHYTRVEKSADGYYAFGLGNNSSYLDAPYLAKFSSNTSTTGIENLPITLVDYIRVNDTLEYGLSAFPACDFTTVPTYMFASVLQFDGNLNEENSFSFSGENLNSYLRPQMHLVNDSLLLIYGGQYVYTMNLHSQEFVEGFLDVFPSDYQAVSIGNNEVVLYNEGYIYQLNVLTLELILLAETNTLQSLAWSAPHQVRLFDSYVALYDDQEVQLASFVFPSSELSTAQVIVENGTIKVMTEEVNDHSKRIYTYDLNLNLLETLLLDDADELNVEYFLWLEDRVFLAGNRRPNSNCHQLNFRYNDFNGQVISPRTEDISVDNVQVNNIHTIINSFPSGVFSMVVRGDVQVTVTNHSDVPVSSFWLTWQVFEQANGMSPQCHMGEGIRFNQPFQELAPGQTLTLSYDNTFIGSFWPQSVGTTFNHVFCITSLAPNQFIDKDQSNDTYCAQIEHVITSVEELNTGSMTLQKLNGSWICTNVRGAQIELFDLTGRLLLRTRSTEDQFFLSEVKENAAFTVVRITKGEELLVQKLSNF